MTVNSDSARNIEYFPDNQPQKFKIHLEEPLHLDNTWTVALVDICIRDNNRIAYTDHLYVFCDLVGETIINGERRQSLLRKVQFFKKGIWMDTYALPYYMRITKTEIFDIEFYIEDRNFKPVSFLKKPVSLTLHFRQYPFFV